MVYVAGVLGFVIGFFSGQALLLRWLKDRPREELLNNKRLAWTYGLFNWMIAALGAYAFVLLYGLYFSS